MHRLALLLCLTPACAHQSAEPAARDPRPAPAAARPTRPPPTAEELRPGLEALSQAGLACYNRGLAHNAVFAKGGVVLVRWRADAAGDLLALDFVRDSFEGWEIADDGTTLASCIARTAGQRSLHWSRTGVAPLRFAPVAAPASRPGAVPQSQPAGAPGRSPAPRPTSAPTDKQNQDSNQPPPVAGAGILDA